MPDELLPAGQHLAAQQRPVVGALGDGAGGRPSYAAVASSRSRSTAVTWSAAASATGKVRRVSERTAPSSVWITTAVRAVASAASAPSQRWISATWSSGSSPSSLTGPSRTTNSGESLSPRLASIRARCVETVWTASSGVRSSTIATAVERSAAWRRNSHGTWSAYRAAEVTNSHRSAAASSWAASSRLRSSTESTSGASRIARPCGTVSEATSWSASGSLVTWLTRSRSGSSRSWPNQPTSSGWCTSTGERVVGRSTPGWVTWCPTSEFTSVDLPAPVEPPTTVSSGASRVVTRGMT